jgi:hypothetical protein
MNNTNTHVRRSVFINSLIFWQHAIPLSQQLQYYKEYQSKLTKIAGRKKTASIIKGALYILSGGSSDFIQNYYTNPLINKFVTPDQYSSYLVDSFSSFVKVYICLFYCHSLNYGLT